jgi:ATP-dependent Clp protease ATP-binding subunit ClpB
VFNILLQVLDDGVLTDGQGRHVDFKQTLIVMTSNLGAGGSEDQVMDAVQRHFRPEFINRIDEIVLFNRLDHADIRRIVGLQVNLLAHRLEAQGIQLQVDESAKDWLAEKGYDPVYGARPLKRAVQTWLQNPLSKQLLDGRLTQGQTAFVSAEPGGAALVFSTA